MIWIHIIDRKIETKQQLNYDIFLKCNFSVTSFTCESRTNSISHLLAQLYLSIWLSSENLHKNKQEIGKVCSRLQLFLLDNLNNNNNKPMMMAWWTRWKSIIETNEKQTSKKNCKNKILLFIEEDSYFQHNEDYGKFQLPLKIRK